MANMAASFTFVYNGESVGGVDGSGVSATSSGMDGSGETDGEVDGSGESATGIDDSSEPVFG